MLGKGWIRGKDGTEIKAVGDAGKPATLTSGESKKGFRIPAKSKIRKTEIAATAEQPGKVETEIELAGESEYVETASQTQASTGTIDTEVRKHQIDVESKRPFLYAAIGCVLAAVACVAFGPWPAAAALAGIAGGAFFALWKISDLPSWFIAVGVAALAIGAGLVVGYKRGEWDHKPKKKT